MADKQTVDDYSPADAVDKELLRRVLKSVAAVTQVSDYFSVDYDREVDVLYVRLVPPWYEAKEPDSDRVDDNFVLDLDGDRLIGISVLWASTVKSLGGKLAGRTTGECEAPRVLRQ